MEATEIRVVEGRGRCVFATKDIAVGEVILASTAAASVALPSERACALCVFVRADSVCTACKNQGLARYCSREHQKSHWAAEHKFECGKLKKLDGLDVDTATKILLLSRLWRGARTVSVEKGGPLHRNTFAEALAMHKDTRPEVLRDCERIAKIALDSGLLAEEAGSKEAKAAVGAPCLSTDTVVALLSSFDSNNFLISDELAHGRGAGVFPAAALLNHSCRPNAVLSYCNEQQFREMAGLSSPAASLQPCALEGQAVQITRALRDIKKGEEICHSFVEIALPRADRQKKLEESYGFLCTCELCTAEQESETTARVLGPHEALRAFPRRALESTTSGRLLPSPTLLSRPAQVSSSSSSSSSFSSSMAVLSADMIGTNETKIRAAARLLRLELCYALTVTGEHATARAGSVKELIRMLQLLCQAEKRFYADRKAATEQGEETTKNDEKCAVILNNSKPLVERVTVACSDALGAEYVRSELQKTKAIRSWLELFDKWRGVIPCLTTDYAYPQFLQSWWKLASGGGSERTLEGPDRDEAGLEVAAIETALVILRWRGSKRSPVSADPDKQAEKEAEPEEDLSCHPAHLAVQAAVNNLLSRYLLLQDSLSAVAACESIVAFHNRAYRTSTAVSSEAKATAGAEAAAEAPLLPVDDEDEAVSVHPLKALQLFTLADVTAELARACSDLYQASRKKSGPAPFSLPLISPQRAVRMQFMFGGLRNGSNEEPQQVPTIVSRREFSSLTLSATLGPAVVGSCVDVTEEQKVTGAAGRVCQTLAAGRYRSCARQVAITLGDRHPFRLAATERWKELTGDLAGK